MQISRHWVIFNIQQIEWQIDCLSIVCWLRSIRVNLFFYNVAIEDREWEKRKHLKNYGFIKHFSFIYHPKRDYSIMLCTFEMERRVEKKKKWREPAWITIVSYQRAEFLPASFIYLFLLALCQYESKFTMDIANARERSNGKNPCKDAQMRLKTS